MIQELFKKIAAQFFSILTKVITDIEQNNNNIINNNNSNNESLKTEFKMDSEFIFKFISKL